MKRISRAISILLAVALVFGLLPQIALGARAAEITEPTDAPAFAGSVSGNLKTVKLTQINPLYANVLDVSDLVEPQAETQAASEYYASIEKAGNAVRKHLKNREESIVVGIQAASDDFQIMHNVFDSALAHTGVPTEGDYLVWQYGGWECSMSGYVSNGVYYLTLTYTVTYYTTAEQEAEMDTAVANLLAELNLGAASDYDKVEGIYDWICKNISYDYANLEDTSYKLKHTAYAALINRTAVCQGYAVLLYRLALELGVDARLISGTGNGGRHGWNIVELDGSYYNLDSTWDATYAQAGQEYQYFLRCDATFSDHIRDAEYTTEAFYAAYPMGQADYVTEGTCGQNLTWTLNTDTGVLTISGTGPMQDYWYDTPWCGHNSKIQSVVIEDGVTSISWGAFYGCTRLTDITIPDSVTSIGDCAFGSCSRLTDIAVAPENPSYRTIDGVLMNQDATELICCPGGRQGSYAIPDSVTSISFGAFAGCSGLTSITIPDSVISIGEYAFYICTSLTSVTIPDRVTSIGDYTFAGCSSLTSVTIPNGVTGIGEGAFDYCDSLIIIGYQNTEAENYAKAHGIPFVALDDIKPGWITYYGNWYYLNSDGAMQTGWLQLGGKWYYMNGSGVMQTGWLFDGGKWYYLNSSGVMQTGWLQLGGKWYFLNGSGVMQTGWLQLGGKWYYLNGSGVMQTGWLATGGKWYYLNSDGSMATWWKQVGGKWYFLSSDGVMRTGWQKDGGKWYYLNSSGVMQTGWLATGGKWYYLNSSGVMQTGWLQLGGKWYYLNTSGAMVTGWQTINGKTYRFNSSGVWIP